MTRFLFDHVQQPDGSFPRDSELNGAVAPDTFGLSEIDEVAYPLLMAWQAGLAGNASFYEHHIRPAADYIVDHGPITGAERWEEHPGFSPATIASEIAGLVAAGKLATAAGDTARADLYFATADDYQRNVKRWTVTTTGPDGPRYFIRESLYGNPNTGADLRPRQRQPQARRSALDHRRRLPGADTAGRALRARSRRPGIAARRRLRARRARPRPAPAGTATGSRPTAPPTATETATCRIRPRCSPTGEPWFTHSVGSGHLWPLLTGERAEQDLQSGEQGGCHAPGGRFPADDLGPGVRARAGLGGPDTPASPFGADPTTASIGFRNGKAAGSAAPLIWGQAQYLRLVLDLQAGTLIDQPTITRARYLDPAPPADVPVTIASPADGDDRDRRQHGRDRDDDARGAVDVAAGQPGSPANTSTVVATVADSHGAYSATIPTPAAGRRSSPRRPRPALTPPAGPRSRSRAEGERPRLRRHRCELSSLSGAELLPDSGDGGEVFVVKRVDEVAKDGILEGACDFFAVAAPCWGEADQRFTPVALVGAALEVSGVDELLHEARGASRADADEPVGQGTRGLRLLIV